MRFFCRFGEKSMGFFKKVSSTALKKRTFGSVKANAKVTKAKEAEPVAEEPAASASSPLAERVGRSRFNFNRGARL